MGLTTKLTGADDWLVGKDSSRCDAQAMQMTCRMSGSSPECCLGFVKALQLIR